MSDTQYKHQQLSAVFKKKSKCDRVVVEIFEVKHCRQFAPACCKDTVKGLKRTHKKRFHL